MNYCELDGDSGSECVDESTHALIRKVRETFDIDNEDVDIPDDDEYMKSFNKFQEEYKNSMKIYLENFKNFDKKEKMSQELTGFMSSLSSKSNGEYIDQMKSMCDEFI